MSKTSDFAHGFATNLPIEGMEYNIDGKFINLDINNEDINVKLEIKLIVTKNSNKAEIWQGGHFVGRCSGENQVQLCGKLTNMVTQEVAEKTQKEALQEVNKELCDYLTGEFERSGFKILNKAGNVDYGSYTVQGPSGDKYLIKATYQDSKVEVFRHNDIKDTNKVIKTFELSNPEIEKQICTALLEYDNKFIPEIQKIKLRDYIINTLANDTFISDYVDEWMINGDGGFITCSTEDDQVIKFRVKEVVLEEVK